MEPIPKQGENSQANYIENTKEITVYSEDNKENMYGQRQNFNTKKKRNINNKKVNYWINFSKYYNNLKFSAKEFTIKTMDVLIIQAIQTLEIEFTQMMKGLSILTPPSLSYIKLKFI